MCKRMFLFFIAAFIITINPNTSSAVIIPAGGETIFRVEFLNSVNSADRINYLLNATDDWKGSIDFYDELSDSVPIFHDDAGISDQISFFQLYSIYLNKTSNSTNFDDPISFVKIAPLGEIDLDVSGIAKFDLVPAPDIYAVVSVVSPVPEPSTLLLLGSGLLGLVGYGRRRMKK